MSEIFTAEEKLEKLKEEREKSCSQYKSRSCFLFCIFSLFKGSQLDAFSP